MPETPFQSKALFLGVQALIQADGWVCYARMKLQVPEGSSKKFLMQNIRIRSDRIGARYYDADLTFWISVDAARVFWSGYRDTTNPINNIDPDGNLWWALIGGELLAISASKSYGDNTGDYGWKNSVVTGIAFFTGFLASTVTCKAGSTFAGRVVRNTALRYGTDTLANAVAKIQLH
jgi:hypothetical protein